MRTKHHKVFIANDKVTLPKTQQDVHRITRYSLSTILSKTPHNITNNNTGENNITDTAIMYKHQLLQACFAVVDGCSLLAKLAFV